MNTIEIGYRPIPFFPWTRKISTTHPSTWGELTPAQSIAVSCVFKGTMTDEKLISIMLGISCRIVRRLPAYYKMKIIELISFVKDYTPYSEFTIKTIGRFRAPKPKLKNEPFGAFIFAESYFIQYNETSDPQYLDRFIACWYRRGIFREADIENRAKDIAKEDIVKREAIYINYQLIREYLALRYPYVFRKADTDTGSKDKSTWVDVFDAIVGDDVKDQDKYAELTVSSVLRYLDKRIQKNLENESKVR